MKIKISPISALLKRRNRVISETIEISYSSGLESAAIGFFFIIFLGICSKPVIHIFQAPVM